MCVGDGGGGEDGDSGEVVGESGEGVKVVVKGLAGGEASSRDR